MSVSVGLLGWSVCSGMNFLLGGGGGGESGSDVCGPGLSALNVSFSLLFSVSPHVPKLSLWTVSPEPLWLSVPRKQQCQSPLPDCGDGSRLNAWGGGARGPNSLYTFSTSRPGLF